ncbi:MAG: hypothetical protein ABSC51_12090 [Gaiellaceae bacterium]
MLSVTVPAGSYDVNGKAEEQNRDSAPAGLYCQLFAGGVTGTSLDVMASTALADGTAGYGNAANVVHGSYTTSTGTTFSLSCQNGGSSTGLYVYDPTLSAIKIGTLH